MHPLPPADYAPGPYTRRCTRGSYQSAPGPKRNAPMWAPRRSVQLRREREPDDRPLERLQPRHGLAPRLLARAVQQGEAAPLELGGGGSDRLGVGDLELDAGLGHRPVVRPRARAEAGGRGLLEGPDPEVLAALDLLAVEVVVALGGGQRQAERVHVERAAASGV